MEIRSAEGGDDAKLFVSNLYSMYQKFCSRSKFQVKELERYNAKIGVSELRFMVTGKNAYNVLIDEAGGHRVQRVPPTTEKRGRRHTSTITVAVLKEDEFKRMNLSNDDITFQAYRGSGNGGQNRNKVSSAVRLVHKETGVAVCCEEERDQHKNKKKALYRLEKKLNDTMQTEHKKIIDEERKVQVGCGMRGDKIRTYNYRENRVTNHVTGKSVNRLREIIEDGRIDLIK
jgi:peptide chain release factor 1